MYASVTLTSSPPPVGLDWRPSPCRSRGVYVVFFVSPCSLCFRLTLPVFEPSLGFFWFFLSFCTGMRGQGTSTPWRLLAQDLAPALLGLRTYSIIGHIPFYSSTAYTKDRYHSPTLPHHVFIHAIFLTIIW